MKNTLGTQEEISNIIKSPCEFYEYCSHKMNNDKEKRAFQNPTKMRDKTKHSKYILKNSKKSIWRVKNNVSVQQNILRFRSKR